MTGNATPIRQTARPWETGPVRGTLLLHLDSSSSRITEPPTGVPQPDSPPSLPPARTPA
jgi:hypothetical protein